MHSVESDSLRAASPLLKFNQRRRPPHAGRSRRCHRTGGVNGYLLTYPTLLKEGRYTNSRQPPKKGQENLAFLSQ
jgi:hypothetical protein